MEPVEIVGFLAAIVGTSLMLPQVIKSLKTKKVDDLSFLMLFLYVLNCALWLAYGLMINALPVIACNFVALLISFFQLFLKLKYGKPSL